MSSRNIIKEKYLNKGRRTIPIQLVIKLIDEIEYLYGRDSDYLDAILILTAEIAKLKKQIPLYLIGGAFFYLRHSLIKLS